MDIKFVETGVRMGKLWSFEVEIKVRYYLRKPTKVKVKQLEFGTMRQGHAFFVMRG